HRAFILLSYLFFISLELFIFYWKDFDFMKSVGVKNKYKYTQVQRELEFAEEVFEREERMEQLNQNE
ncbi:MAG: hypothetical protein L0L10_08105, partial [Tetragenococcus sp.]|nr:hypothetical protein [Tetragenococcus sp.]